MKVQLADGSEYLIHFSYLHRPHRDPRGKLVEGQTDDYTLCGILDASLPRAPEGAPLIYVAQATAKRHVYDAPDKHEARKGALENALHELDRVLPIGTGAQQGQWHKERRAKFWAAYLSRKPLRGRDLLVHTLCGALTETWRLCQTLLDEDCAALREEEGRASILEDQEATEAAITSARDRAAAAIAMFHAMEAKKAKRAKRSKPAGAEASETGRVAS